MPNRNCTHSHDEQFAEVRAALATLVKHVTKLTKEIKAMSAALDNLTAKVAANTTVVESAITLIGGLADQLRAAANDPAAVNALADQLDTEDAKLANAITTNTPAA